MIFNKRLLSIFDSVDIQKAKLAIICLHENIDKNLLRFDLNFYYQALVIGGLAKINEEGCFQLNLPVYVEKEVKITESQIQEVRQFFFKSYCKVINRSLSKAETKEALEIYLEKHTEFSIQNIVTAVKQYIDHHVGEFQEEYIQKLENFIADENKGLTYWIENSMVTIKHTEDGLSDFVQ